MNLTDDQIMSAEVWYRMDDEIFHEDHEDIERVGDRADNSDLMKAIRKSLGDVPDGTVIHVSWHDFGCSCSMGGCNMDYLVSEVEPVLVVTLPSNVTDSATKEENDGSS